MTERFFAYLDKIICFFKTKGYLCNTETTTNLYTIMKELKTKNLHLDEFINLEEAITEAGTILDTWGRVYDAIRIIGKNNRCVRVIKRS